MSMDLSREGLGFQSNASASRGSRRTAILAGVLAVMFLAALATRTHIGQCQALETSPDAMSACMMTN